MAMSDAERQRAYRERHPEIALQIIEKHRRLKAEVLTYYGDGKCACVVCGEGRLACLSIDHIEGGGNKLRGQSLRPTKQFYKWLKNGGYPGGYQTLCMNCQFVKRFERGEHN